jgi:hypothetical protein
MGMGNIGVCAGAVGLKSDYPVGRFAVEPVYILNIKPYLERAETVSVKDYRIGNDRQCRCLEVKLYRAKLLVDLKQVSIDVCKIRCIYPVGSDRFLDAYQPVGEIIKRS